MTSRQRERIAAETIENRLEQMSTNQRERLASETTEEKQGIHRVL